MRYIAGILVILICDRVAKWTVSSGMYEGESFDAVEGFLSFTYVKNDGIAFGMLGGRSGILVAGTAAVLILLLVFLFSGYGKKTDRLFRWGLTSVIGGGLGNLIDRIVYGYVIDFIDFKIWRPVFNIADVFVCVGCGLIILDLLLSLKKGNGKEDTDGQDGAEA